MKKEYQAAQIEVVLFEVDDVVRVSDNFKEDIFNDWE